MISLLSLILFISLGIFIVTLVVDPNQFKPDIQSTATNAGVELDIDGDLEWQLLPFGLSAEKVNFVFSNQSMAGSADQLRFGIGVSTKALANCSFDGQGYITAALSIIVSSYII